MATLPTVLMWVVSRSPGFSEEVTFGWFAYTPLSADYLIFLINALSLSMALIQLAVPALIALVPLLFVRRWTAFAAGMVLLVGGIAMGGFRLVLGDGPGAVTPNPEFSALYAGLLLAACYLVAAILLFIAATRLTAPLIPAPAAATPDGPTAPATPPAPTEAATAASGDVPDDAPGPKHDEGDDDAP